MIQRLSTKLWVIGLGLEGLALLASFLEASGDVNAFFQAAARLSGRVSLLFFALLLVYATLHPTLERTSATFLTKYRLYRDFAILHGIHWVLLATSVWLNGFELVATRLAAGALAYCLVLGMPIAVQTERLSTRFLERLQGFYLFWVWFVFFMTYVTRLSGQNPSASGTVLAWWPLAVFSAGLMLWRVWKIWKHKN